MSRHRAAPGPAQLPRRREGRRRSGSGRRGVAAWPIVSVAVVTVLAVGWLGWSYAGDVLERRAAAQLAACVDGDATVTVAVAPSLSDVVARAAKTWTRSRPVVLDHCVRVEVAAIEPQRVLDGLTAGWDAQALGVRPGAWLPDSSLWVNRLSAQDATLLASEPASIATSPVVLALQEEAAFAIRTGNSFDWGKLHELVSDGSGWERYGRPDWGRFTIAMPDVATNPASALALQSALAGASPQRIGPVTVDTLADPGVRAAMTTFAAHVPAVGLDTTAAALGSLAATTAGSGEFDAVPVLEHQLYQRNVGADGQPALVTPLTGLQGAGPTPTADYPFVALKDERTDQFQVRAAQKFREFLQTDSQQLEFSKSGLRVASTKVRPNPAPGLRWEPTQQDLVAADANTTQQISAAWTNAGSGGQVVTVLLDVSESMLEDGGEGRTKLEWVQEALRGQVERFGSGALGLWEFSADRADGEPYRLLVPTGPVAEQRDALLESIDGLDADGATLLYPSLLVAHETALEGLADGRRNRLVVITDSDDNSDLSYEDLTAQLDEQRAGDPDLAISVIAIGDLPNAPELTELARTTGGTFSTVEDGTGVEAALGQLLSAD